MFTNYIGFIYVQKKNMYCRSNGIAIVISTLVHVVELCKKNVLLFIFSMQKKDIIYAE